MPFLLCIGIIYVLVFIRSFLCPKHPHVLNVYFGVPGSGKTIVLHIYFCPNSS